MNNPKNPYGVDFTIKGNSFVATSTAYGRNRVPYKYAKT